MKRLGSRRQPQGGASGFTLVELLIAMAMFLVVLAAIYGAYESQQRTYVIQRQVANMQQNQRAGMFYLTQAIRMAGFDPEDSDVPGLVSGFAAYPGAGATCDDTTIAFTVDDNRNRVIDNDDSELVAFRINDRMELQRFSTGAITWQTLAENIETLTFVYRDEDGNVTADLADVRTVEVTLTARTERPDRLFAGDGYRRRTHTSLIQCRNLGL